MRISDWSSDVCSSDLIGHPLIGRSAAAQPDGGFQRLKIGLCQAIGHRGGELRLEQLADRIDLFEREVLEIEIVGEELGRQVGREDRKSGVWGRGGTVSGDLRGRLSLYKKQHIK